jgi:hypothetical protein
MAHEDAFGFLDPADVLRGCHIIPAFAAKKRYADGKGLSRCAGDSGDWNSYYVNRYAHVSRRFLNPDHLLPDLWTVICLCGIIGDMQLAMYMHIKSSVIETT